MCECIFTLYLLSCSSGQQDKPLSTSVFNFMLYCYMLCVTSWAVHVVVHDKLLLMRELNQKCLSLQSIQLTPCCVRHWCGVRLPVSWRELNQKCLQSPIQQILLLWFDASLAPDCQQAGESLIRSVSSLWSIQQIPCCVARPWCGARLPASWRKLNQ